MAFACPCATVRALGAPLPSRLPQLAVVVPGDGMADWRYEADPATSRGGAGLPRRRRLRAAMYEALARYLAAAVAVTGERASAGPAAS
jgi:hypothetical protein